MDPHNPKQRALAIIEVVTNDLRNMLSKTHDKSERDFLLTNIARNEAAAEWVDKNSPGAGLAK